MEQRSLITYFMKSLISNHDLIGEPRRAGELSGPALILNKDTFYGNLTAMADRCTAAGITLRPHAKTHKSAFIALEQIKAGAVGICCATAHEVIKLGQLGVKNILLTSPLAEPRKISALVLLAHDVQLTVVVDHASQVSMWDEALAGKTENLDVLADVDIGMGRTGVRDGGIVELARQIQASKYLNYVGIQAYSGLVQHITSFEERQDVYATQMEKLKKDIEALREAGVAPKVISGGGTGTMSLDLSMGLLTELQFGSYAFMDVEYEQVELVEKGSNPFRPALFVRASVISANVPGQVTVNAGSKSLSADGPAPVLHGRDSSWHYEFFGDEYGRVSGPGVDDLKLGDYVDIVVPHCDPTVNLHDFYHLVDDETLVAIWHVDGRGAL